MIWLGRQEDRQLRCRKRPLSWLTKARLLSWLKDYLYHFYIPSSHTTTCDVDSQVHRFLWNVRRQDLLHLCVDIDVVVVFCWKRKSKSRKKNKREINIMFSIPYIKLVYIYIFLFKISLQKNIIFVYKRISGRHDLFRSSRYFFPRSLNNSSILKAHFVGDIKYIVCILIINFWFNHMSFCESGKYWKYVGNCMT